MSLILLVILFLVILYLAGSIKRIIETNSKLNLRGLPKDRAWRKAIRAITVKWHELELSGDVKPSEISKSVVGYYSSVTTSPQDVVDAIIMTLHTDAIPDDDTAKKIQLTVKTVLTVYAMDKNMAYENLFPLDDVEMFNSIFEEEYRDLLEGNMLRCYDSKGNIK